jgi:hypothetical protein
MGGDGGVIASNRKYMRGAGSADHTADSERHQQQQKSFNAQEAMTTCALTNTKLSKESPMVACAYGKLYHKEAAIQTLLLRRKGKAPQTQAQQQQTQTDDLGEQVRKLSDLYDVRFHYENNGATSTTTATCPITSKVLNGSISAILLVPGKAETPNVVSESAFSLLPETELETEYGPIQQKIRLAPPKTMLEQIKKQVQEQRRQKEDDLRKQQHKNGKKKKRKQRDDEKVSSSSSSSSSRPKRATTTTEAAKSRVETAIKSNKVLSSLFTTKKSISEKDHKDNLFAR